MKTVKLVSHHDKDITYICKHMVINARQVPSESITTFRDVVTTLSMTCLVCKRHQNKSITIIQKQL